MPCNTCTSHLFVTYHMQCTERHNGVYRTLCFQPSATIRLSVVPSCLLPATRRRVQRLFVGGTPLRQDLGVSPRPPSLTRRQSDSTTWLPPRNGAHHMGSLFAVLYAICCNPSLLSTTASWISSKKVSNLNVRMELKVAVSRMHRRWACPQIKRDLGVNVMNNATHHHLTFYPAEMTARSRGDSHTDSRLVRDEVH